MNDEQREMIRRHRAAMRSIYFLQAQPAIDPSPHFTRWLRIARVSRWAVEPGQTMGIYYCWCN